MAPMRPRIRDEIRGKLCSLSINPIGALTHAMLDVFCTDSGTRAVAREMMVEARAVTPTPTPTIGTVLALVKLRAKVAGLHAI